MTEEDDLELTRARARVGITLRGKYKLDSVLGVGGMAVVYAATHRNKKRFAVKMLHPELSMRQDVRDRFVREGYVANSIEHPNALAVLDDDVAEDGAAFVVMELLHGLTVDELWESRGHKLPPRAVLAIAHGLLDVLAAAHHKSIVHRDIKPANVFVLADGTVKVLDFGIARLRDAASKGATSTGMILGTPAFLPPEQALAKSSEIDHRTDIWAVGATMFTLLSGMLVHEGENGAQLVIQTATQPARSLATAAPDVPRAIVSIVDQALAFEKVSRWSTAEAMRDAIESAHLSLFGEPLSKAPLAALMARGPVVGMPDLGMLQTAAAAAPPAGMPRDGALPNAPTVSGPAPTLASDGRAPARSGPGDPDAPTGMVPAPIASLNRAGGTTAQPVMSALAQVKEFEPPQPQVQDGPPPRRKLPWIVPLAAGCLVLGLGGVTVALKLTSTPSAPPPPTAASAAPAVSSVVTTVVTSVVSPAASSESEPKPTPAVSDASVASASPLVRARVATTPRPAPAGPSAPIPSAKAVAPPDCTVKYGFDATGRKIWKKECLE